MNNTFYVYLLTGIIVKPPLLFIKKSTKNGNWVNLQRG